MENIGTFLNYPIKEFIMINYKIDYEKLLKEFNKKYNLNIKDTKIEKLDLRWKGSGNGGLEDLCKIEFKELKELILNNNNISDIKILSKAKFKKLEILDLSQNKISDINVFIKINFKGLKQLYLCYNNISDIKVFERVNLEELEILYMNDNKIDKTKDSLIISNLKNKIANFQV
jgi:Leucine-rich repeat (LRR) protein